MKHFLANTSDWSPILAQLQVAGMKANEGFCFKTNNLFITAPSVCYYSTCRINISEFCAHKTCILSRKTFIWFSEGKQSRDDPEIVLHILLAF